MHLIDEILNEDPDRLTGADLFIYNVACQIHDHPRVDWNILTISQLISQTEQFLD